MPVRICLALGFASGTSSILRTSRALRRTGKDTETVSVPRRAVTGKLVLVVES